MIVDARRRLTDLFEGLAAEEWDVRSLCGEWTVRDVAAHVTAG